MTAAPSTTTTVIDVPRRAPARPAALDRAARHILHKALARLATGRLTIQDPDGTVATFGRVGSVPAAHLSVLDHRFYRACLTRGTLGAGESFVDGWWTSDTLTDLVRLFVLNRDSLRTVDSGFSTLLLPIRRALQKLTRNTRTGSRRNIAAHYDLSNDLFAVMLDPTMTYSCAIFDRPDMSLGEASVAKLDRICRKLQLSPNHHLLEIGTGWGSLAMHAAERYGCRVTTTTISKAQASLVRQRIEARGLTTKIEVLEKDYRDLTGQFDRIASIEMIEAVGHQFLDAYFGACGRLLKPDGLMALQAITIQDRDYEHALVQVDLIQRHIFPGSFIPSLGAMQASLARSTSLRVIHIEDIGDHYVQTLGAWRASFRANLQRVHDLGFDERFVRLWDFYLCYCQGAFQERHIGDAQIVIAGPAFRGSSTPSPASAVTPEQ